MFLCSLVSAREITRNDVLSDWAPMDVKQFRRGLMFVFLFLLCAAY